MFARFQSFFAFAKSFAEIVGEFLSPSFSLSLSSSLSRVKTKSALSGDFPFTLNIGRKISKANVVALLLVLNQMI